MTCEVLYPSKEICNLNIVMHFLPLLDGVSLSLIHTAFILVWRASFSLCRLSIFLCASWSFFSKSLFSSCVCMKIRFNINISHVGCKWLSLNTCVSGLFETHTQSSNLFHLSCVCFQFFLVPLHQIIMHRQHSVGIIN